MTQKAVSPMWSPGGPALWDQPARQTTLALSPLCADLCVDQFVQQAPAAAGVVRTLDYRGVYHPATSGPERVQPADAPPADCVVVTPAAAAPRRFLGLSPPALRWHERGSSQRRLCGDGCGPVCRRLCGARDAAGPTHLQPFCARLARHGLAPLSATVDGTPHLLRLLRRQWPTIRIQRCLVPIQRQGLSWCRRQPKRRDAQRLRALFRQVMAIHTVAAREQFVAQVQSWEHRYGARLAGTTETGWVGSDLKRARSLLLAALPNMFHDLDDPAIPKSTNALEGYFARLKHTYRHHRGLAQAHRSAYFRWYVQLCPR